MQATTYTYPDVRIVLDNLDAELELQMVSGKTISGYLGQIPCSVIGIHDHVLRRSSCPTYC